MGRHPCERCFSEEWGYSCQYCPADCDYAPNLGIELCDRCLIERQCLKCEKSGCEFCIRPHCDSCKAKVCKKCKPKIKPKDYACGDSMCDVLGAVDGDEEPACINCVRTSIRHAVRAKLAADVALVASIVDQCQTDELHDLLQKFINDAAPKLQSKQAADNAVSGGERKRSRV